MSYFLFSPRGVVEGRWVERLRREQIISLVSSEVFFRSPGFRAGSGGSGNSAGSAGSGNSAGSWLLGWDWGDWWSVLGLRLRGGDGVGLGLRGFGSGFGRGSMFSTWDASRLSWRNRRSRSASRFFCSLV